MIRHVRGDEHRDSPEVRPPSPEVLERRREYLRDSAGAWDNPEGERLAHLIEEMFESPEPQPPNGTGA